MLVKRQACKHAHALEEHLDLARAAGFPAPDFDLQEQDEHVLRVAEDVGFTFFVRHHRRAYDRARDFDEDHRNHEFRCQEFLAPEHAQKRREGELVDERVEPLSQHGFTGEVRVVERVERVSDRSVEPVKHHGEDDDTEARERAQGQVDDDSYPQHRQPPERYPVRRHSGQLAYGLECSPRNGQHPDRDHQTAEQVQRHFDLSGEVIEHDGIHVSYPPGGWQLRSLVSKKQTWGPFSP